MLERLKKPSSRRLLLLLFLLAESVVAVHFWNRWQPKHSFGFLIKNGERYIVAWNNPDGGYETESYPTLQEALLFANQELEMKASPNPLADLSLERVWLQDRAGVYTLFWKVSHLQFLNRLTFQNAEEARYFEDAFRKGAYTPSPFGHSMFLTPTHTE